MKYPFMLEKSNKHYRSLINRVYKQRSIHLGLSLLANFFSNPTAFFFSFTFSNEGRIVHYSWIYCPVRIASLRNVLKLLHMLAGNHINQGAYFLGVNVGIYVEYMTHSVEMKAVEKRADYLFGMSLMDWAPCWWLAIFLKELALILGMTRF